MGTISALPKTTLVSAYDSTNHCHKTEVVLKGANELVDFKREVWTMMNTNKINLTERDSIEAFSDGYFI